MRQGSVFCRFLTTAWVSAGSEPEIGKAAEGAWLGLRQTNDLVHFKLSR